MARARRDYDFLDTLPIFGFKISEPPAAASLFFNKIEGRRHGHDFCEQKTLVSATRPPSGLRIKEHCSFQKVLDKESELYY
jgi:hypothetical protein